MGHALSAFLARRVLAVLALVAVAALTSAAAPGADDDAAGGDKLDLKLRLKKGEAYHVGVVVDQDITQTAPGAAQPQAMKQKIGMGYRMEVLDVDAEGKATLRTAYHDVSFRQESPAGVIAFDSSKPDGEVPPAARGFAALAGQQFTMALTRDGKVTEIRGVQEMLDAIVEKLDMPPGPTRDAMAKTIKEQFGETAMREQMQNLFAFYPDQPVGVGDSWTQTVRISMGFPMVLENTYALKSRNAGVATIAVETKLGSNPDAKPLEMGTISIAYDLSGTQAGDLTVDEATGWTTAAKLKQDITGDMTVAAGGNAQKVPLTIKSDVNLTSNKAEAAATDKTPKAAEEATGDDK
jgi:hypothetical protein